MHIKLNRVISSQEHSMSIDDWYDYMGRVCISVCSVPAMLGIAYEDTKVCATWTIAIGFVWFVTCAITFVGHATR